MIRRAKKEDVDGIFELLVSAHDRSEHYNKVGYSELRTTSFLYNMIAENPNMYITVDVDGDEINGVLVGEIQPDWLTDGHRAFTHIIYAEPGHNGIALIRDFIKYAKSWKKVKKIMIATSYDDERSARVDRLFQSMGFSPVGKQYMEVV
jgi:hypothetical protein